MALLTASQLADMLEHKMDWSARVPLVEDLRAYDLTLPSSSELADLAEDTASGTYAQGELQAVMDTLAGLVTALKAQGILIDPA